MTEPRWITRRMIDAAHDDLVYTFGGITGIRDETALESALARPQQKFFYEEDASFATLCAAYGFGIAKNHPYNDGNKRSAYMAMRAFARFNGCDIKATEAEVVEIMIAVAASHVDEDGLARWLEEHVVKKT